MRDMNMASRRDDVRFKMLRLVERHPECARRDLADLLGVSLRAVRYYLRALVDKEHIKVDSFRRLPRNLPRKMRKYEVIRNEIETLLAEEAVRLPTSMASG